MSKKTISILLPLFSQKSTKELVYTPVSGLKSMMFMIWVYGGAFAYGSGLLFAILERDILFWKHDGPGELAIFWIVNVILLVSFWVWYFAKPTLSIFNRSTQTVYYESNRHRFAIPWTQIRFRTLDIPTKFGAETAFMVYAVPPFPDELFSGNPSIRKRLNAAESSFNLGTFGVKNREEAQRFVEFFNVYMASDYPAEEVYRKAVISPPGESYPYKGLQIS